MKLRCLGAALSVLLAAGGTAALADGQTTSEDRTLKATQLEEYLNPKVSVSGGVRAGVMAGDLETFNLGRLFVDLPRIPKGQLCVELVSRDGRYGARFRAGQPTKTGVNQIEFSTKHAKALKADGTVYLAALVSERRDCDSPIEAIFPASWTNTFDSDSFTVLLNSGRLTTTLALDGSTTLKCEPLKHTQRVAFDTMCKVERADGLSGGSSSDRVLNFTVKRERYFNRLEPIPLPIARGSGVAPEE